MLPYQFTNRDAAQVHESFGLGQQNLLAINFSPGRQRAALAISDFNAAIVSDTINGQKSQIVRRELVFNSRIAQPDNQFHAASIHSAPLPDHVRTAAPGCPVEQSSTAQDSYQGTTFSFAPALSEQSESKDATNASRLTALAAAGLCQDNTRAFGALPYDQPSELDRYQMIRTYFQMLIEEELPDAVGKMKQFASWFTHGVPGGAGLRKAIYESKSALEILGRVEEFFEARLQPCGAGAPAKADSDLAVLG